MTSLKTTCLLALSLFCAANNSRGMIGATTPFTSVEAENGFLGGGATAVFLTSAPTNQYSSPALEASGHAYVQLTAIGQYVQWTNSTGQNITALNLRSSIPDAPAGGGTSSTIDLYVNGVFRQAFAVNSLQNYCYEGTNYNGQTDKNPADGGARDFWNDTHAFITGVAVAPGQTLKLQMDSANSAAFYDIDVIDLEAPPSALTQPANSLSIVTYGALSNNIGFDNTAAINNCFSAAAAQKKSAWIPPGIFYINADSGGLNATGIAITGAGPWYSTIYRVTPVNNQQGIANIIDAVSCTLANVLLDCNSSSRAGNNNDGAVDFSGTNWLVTNVWIQHVTSSFWCAGVNGAAVNCRTLSTWADGGNFNNVQSADGIGMNLLYSNNFVRGTGDDAMAINSVHLNINGSTTNYYTMMSNITYVNNTAIGPWGGKCIGLYGGANDRVANNLLCDTPRYLGLGVMRFGVNGSDLLSAIVTNNILLRCGGNGYNQQQQGMMIGNGGDAQGVGTVENAYVAYNSIIDSLYDAVGFSTSTNIVFEYNTIINPGLDGVAIGPPDLGSGVAGSAILNYNTLTGLIPGRSAFVNSAGNYIAGGISNAGFTVPGPVPAPWLNQDIGSVAVAGGVSYSKDAFSIVGSGTDVGGVADSFNYTYQPAAGNCSISSQVLTEEIFNPSAKAGVMIRNSTDPADLEVSVMVTPENGILFQSRTTYGGVTAATAVPGVTAPYWVRLARNGNIFTPSCSLDGVTWTTIGSPTTVAMASTVSAGLAITSDTNGALSSAMIDNVSVILPGMQYAAVHWEGDLMANLQSSDLNASSPIWTNRTSNSNGVGNFAAGSGNLNVATLAWGSQTVKALYVNQTIGNAVQSALAAPAEIVGNNPVSAEAWVYATAVNEQNSCAVGYGLQGGPSAPEEDREFNYSNPCCGGGVSGDFGSYDTPWATTPAAGAWHYLAWTYDGSTVRLYLDGILNTSNNPGSPLQTPATLIGVGAGLSGGPNIAVDAFQGCIAAARLESGVLSETDIATNYALGLLATAAAITPAGLAATPGDGNVVLTWNSSGNATGYNVKSSASASGPYSLIATNLNSLIFTNAGLSDGTEYYFVVSALNSAGESANSTAVSVRPVSLAAPRFSYQVMGGAIQITWPQDHTGWTLQAQTNLSKNGISTNWFSLPASTLTNEMVFPIGVTNGSVFFRLVYP